MKPFTTHPAATEKLKTQFAASIRKMFGPIRPGEVEAARKAIARQKKPRR